MKSEVKKVVAGVCATAIFCMVCGVGLAQGTGVFLVGDSADADFAEIQDALDEAQADLLDEVVIIVEGGTFSGVITVHPEINVTMLGLGEQTILTSAQVDIMPGAGDVEMDGFVLDGNGSGPVIRVDGTENQVVLSALRVGSGSIGIDVRDSESVDIVNCIIEFSTGSGIAVENSTVTIRNNTIRDNEGAGIDLSAQSGGEIFNNIIFNNDGIGIRCEAGTVIGIEPATGDVGGGDPITIRGFDLEVGTEVTFGSAAPVGGTLTEGADGAPDELEVTLPASSDGAEPVNVLITNPGTGLAVFIRNGFTYTTTAGPTVSGIRPTSGFEDGETIFEITGTNFSPGATVEFDGTAAPIVSVIDSQTIRGITPAGTAGPPAVDVTVTTAAGTATLGLAFTYDAIPEPVIQSVGPNTIDLINATGTDRIVTIRGENLTDVPLGVGAVTFDPGLLVGSADVLSVTDTEIEVEFSDPADAAAGFHDVIVQDISGRESILFDGFYFVPDPNILDGATIAIEPGFGSTSGGDVVHITSVVDAFGPLTEVSFSDVPAAGITVISPKELEVVTPPNSAGPSTVLVSHEIPTGPVVPALPGAFEYVDEIPPSLAGPELSFNDVWNNSGANTGSLELANYENCAPGSGSISADPILADNSEILPRGGDVLSDSPVVDAGTDSGAPSVDFFGFERPAAGGVVEEPKTDIGAHEFPFGIDGFFRLAFVRTIPDPVPESDFGEVTMIITGASLTEITSLFAVSSTGIIIPFNLTVTADGRVVGTNAFRIDPTTDIDFTGDSGVLGIFSPAIIWISDEASNNPLTNQPFFFEIDTTPPVMVVKKDLVHNDSNGAVFDGDSTWFFNVGSPFVIRADGTLDLPPAVALADWLLLDLIFTLSGVAGDGDPSFFAPLPQQDSFSGFGFGPEPPDGAGGSTFIVTPEQILTVERDSEIDSREQPIFGTADWDLPLSQIDRPVADLFFSKIIDYGFLDIGPQRYQYDVTARDRAGNPGQDQLIIIWDQTPPTTTIVSRPPDPATSTTLSFSYVASDTLSPSNLFRYNTQFSRLDAVDPVSGVPPLIIQPFLDYTPNTTVEFIAALFPAIVVGGTYRFIAVAVDPAGNYEEPFGPDNTYEFTIAANVPDTTISGCPPSPTRERSFLLEVGAEPQELGVDFRMTLTIDSPAIPRVTFDMDTRDPDLRLSFPINIIDRFSGAPRVIGRINLLSGGIQLILDRLDESEDSRDFPVNVEFSARTKIISAFGEEVVVEDPTPASCSWTIVSEKLRPEEGGGTEVVDTAAEGAVRRFRDPVGEFIDPRFTRRGEQAVKFWKEITR